MLPNHIINTPFGLITCSNYYWQFSF